MQRRPGEPEGTKALPAPAAEGDDGHWSKPSAKRPGAGWERWRAVVVSRYERATCGKIRRAPLAAVTNRVLCEGNTPCSADSTSAWSARRVHGDSQTATTGGWVPKRLRHKPRQRRAYGVLTDEMAIWKTPDISCVFKRVYAICFAKRRFDGSPSRMLDWSPPSDSNLDVYWVVPLAGATSNGRGNTSDPNETCHC